MCWIFLGVAVKIFLIKFMLDTQNFMKSQLEQLGDIDGLAKWRKEESEKLSSLVQSAITRNQNPTDCGQAKKLVCHLNQKGCGLGCIIHHGVQCLLTAFGTGRVLFISNQTWGYNDRFVIKQFFSPISSSCSDFESKGLLKSFVLLIKILQVLQKLLKKVDVASII